MKYRQWTALANLGGASFLLEPMSDSTAIAAIFPEILRRQRSPSVTDRWLRRAN